MRSNDVVYDIIIIGSGIGGLYTAHNLINTTNLLILEKKNRIAGRIKTIKNKDLTYDVGAGRISSNHNSVLKLIQKFNLKHKLVDIGNHNKKEMREIIKILSSHSKKKQQTTTVHNLIKSTVSNNFYKNYGFYNNIKNQSGESFINYAKNNYGKTFYILKGGLEQITNNLYIQLKKNIRYGITVKKISYTDNIFTISNGSNEIFKCKILILAIPKEEIIKLSYFKENKHIHNILKSVSHNNPYIRVFLQFPKINNKYWFHDLGVNIHNTKLIRYFIPIDYKKGLIQLYSDNIIAKRNLKLLLDNEAYTKILIKELQKIYKDKNIPEPIFREQYYWKNGTHFWLPHKLSVNKRYNIVLQPNKEEKLFICGESYSKHQAWMEGALKTSEKVISKIVPLVSLKNGGNFIQNRKKLKQSIKRTKIKTKKYKKISQKQLKNHDRFNKKKWIAIRRKKKIYVYDVTKWLNNHPGGSAILLKYAGTDATKNFMAIGHSEYATKIMEKFKIGFLQE